MATMTELAAVSTSQRRTKTMALYFFSASYRIGTESWVGFDFGLGLVGGLLLGCSTAR
jgi:hypothetical protein